MKKTIIRAIAILVIATFIVTPGAFAASTTATSTEVLNPLELFPMSLTPKELLVVLKKQKMDIIPPDPNYYGIGQIGEDGRIYDGAIVHFWYECEGIKFVFYADDEKMAYIIVTGDRFATPEGIRVGASRRDVNKTYGVCHKLRGCLIDALGFFSPVQGYDAKTKDGYYRFNFGDENKKCGSLDSPLDSWSFYVDRIKRYS